MWTLCLILRAGRRKLSQLYQAHLVVFSASLKQVLQPGLPQEAPLTSSHTPVWLQLWLSPAACFGVTPSPPDLTQCLMLEPKYYPAKAEISPPVLRGSSQKHRIPIECDCSLVDLFERNLFKLRTATRAEQNCLFPSIKYKTAPAVQNAIFLS